MSRFRNIIGVCLCVTSLVIVTAAGAAASAVERAPAIGNAIAGIIEIVKGDLSKRYPLARIQLGDIRWAGHHAPAAATAVRIIGEIAPGELQISAVTSKGEIEGRVPFAAWTAALIATRRVLPGQRLAEDMFRVGEVNVAQGYAREFRGAILPIDSGKELSRLEARQTIMEGSFALSTAVQRIPDVRRGESVSVHLVSGAMTLKTMAVAEEPAYVDGQLRVLTLKTKRVLVGKLMQDGSVEVKL